MLDYRTLRRTFQIPWLRDNRAAIHELSDLFYLMLALFRAGRRHDFVFARDVYFRMLASFAQYGRRDARQTVESLLQLPWYRDRERELYRLIAAFNRVIRENSAIDDPSRPTAALGAAVGDYVTAMKALIGFDEQDEARVRRLMASPADLDRGLSLLRSHLAEVD